MFEKLQEYILTQNNNLPSSVNGGIFAESDIFSWLVPLMIVIFFICLTIDFRWIFIMCILPNTFTFNKFFL